MRPSRGVVVVIWAEAILCFAPMLSVLMFAVGLVPVWIVMLLDGIRSYATLARRWERASVAALVPGVIWAAAGFIALIRLLVLISPQAQRDRWRRFTLFTVS